MPLIHLDPRTGIEAIHGRIGEFIFYTRNGKQCVRRRSVHTPSGDYREIIESLSNPERLPDGTGRAASA